MSATTKKPARKKRAQDGLRPSRPAQLVTLVAILLGIGYVAFRLVNWIRFF